MGNISNFTVQIWACTWSCSAISALTSTALDMEPSEEDAVSRSILLAFSWGKEGLVNKVENNGALVMGVGLLNPQQSM